MVPEVPPGKLRRLVVSDLAPVRPLAPPWQRALWLVPPTAGLAWLASGYGLGRASAGWNGPWAWTAAQGAFALALLGAGLRESVPGRELPAGSRAGLLGLAGLLPLAGMLAGRADGLVPLGFAPTEWGRCFGTIAALGALLLLAAWQLAARALPLCPLRVGALCGAGAGLALEAARRLACGQPSDLRHLAAAHLGALVGLALLGLALGRAYERGRERRDLAALLAAPGRRGVGRPIPPLGALVTAASALVALLPARAPAPGTAAAPTVAVLDFAVEPGNSSQERFVDGVGERLGEGLARRTRLVVVGRKSVAAFRGRNVDVREVGRALNASYVVRGVVSRHDGRVRLVTRLFRAQDGSVAWSGVWEGPLRSAFEESVASAVARELEAERAGGTVPPEAGPEAYALFLRARSGIRLRTRQGLEAAVADATRALELEPGFAPAWVARAEAQALLADAPNYYGNTPARDAAARARSDLEKALALDPGSARAYAVLGGLVENLVPSHAGAQDEALARALELDPGLTEAAYWSCNGAERRGDWRRQILCSEQLFEREPLWPNLLGSYVRTEVVKGDYARAEAAVASQRRYFPGHPMVAAMESTLAAARGELARAARLVAEGLRRDPGNRYLASARARLYALLGAFDQAPPELLQEGRPYFLWARGEAQAAALAARQEYGVDPSDPVRRLTLASFEGLAGHHERVIALVGPLADAEPDQPAAFFGCDPYRGSWVHNAAALLALAWRERGRPQEADAVMRRLGACLDVYAALGVRGRSATDIRALEAAYLGRREPLFAALEEAWALGHRDLNFWRLPLVGWLSDDAEWRALVQRHRTAIAAERRELGLPAPGRRDAMGSAEGSR